jgi:LysM repeat protein
MKKFFYRVEENESLISVAEKFSIPPSILIKENNLKQEISTGDLLVIPPFCGRVYKVQPQDTLDSISKKFKVEKEKILIDNALSYIFYGLNVIVENLEK